MKKRLLFVMNSLTCGGAEKALISLLETIDYSLYQVDLFLFRHEGLFLNKLPQEVCLLPEPPIYKYFDMPIKKALVSLMKRGEFKAVFYRCMLGYFAKREDNASMIEQRLWKYISNTLIDINTEYDAAIGFLERSPIYFCIDKVKAKRKMGWIHTDYNKLGTTYRIDKLYFEKLNYLITVSDELVSILKKRFPELESKIYCIHNIVSSKMIKKLSQENVEYKNDDHIVSIISVGRLAKEKGLDISLDAIEILVKKGHPVRWYLIGEGNVRGELEKRIKEKRLESHVTLLGLKENPYPYIRKSDIYIQTSRYEGKSISIDEAKILAKPIVITNFRTAADHIKHQKNGMIANMDAASVASHLELLIKDKQLRKKFMNNLEREEFGTEDEIHKLYEWIG